MTESRQYRVKVLRWDSIDLWCEDEDEVRDMVLLMPDVLQIAEDGISCADGESRTGESK